MKVTKAMKAMSTQTKSAPGSALAPAALLLASTFAHADGPAPRADLRVRSFPSGAEVSSLQMRLDQAAKSADGAAVRPNARAARRTIRTAEAADIGQVLQEGMGALSGQAQADDVAGENRQSYAGGGYKMFPTTSRDIQERVIFRVNVGAALDNGTLSGETFRTGFNPADVNDPANNAFLENRQYLLGDATLGSNGVILPSLNTYFLSHFILDVDGGSEYAAFNNIYDNLGGREIAIHAGYAELDGLTQDKSGPLGKAWLKAGRQYRYGGARFITNFDGVAFGYDDAGFDAAAFLGQRASQYIDENPGIVAGGGVKLRGKELFKAPVDLALDYLFFDGGGEQDINGDGIDDIDLARQYVELSSRVQLGRTYIYFRSRIVDNGELADNDLAGDDSGFGLGRIGVQVRQPVGLKLLVVADLEQKFAREVAYDYINPVGADVLNVAQQVGVGLDAPEDSLLVGLRVNYLLSRKLELYGFGRANVVQGDNVISSYNASYQDFGAAVSARLGNRGAFQVTAQAKARFTDLDDDANIVDEANGIFTEFFNTAGSGVSEFEELSAEMRYRAAGRSGDPRWSGALGAYFRVYDLQSPYAIVEDDARAGGRADFNYWFSRNLRTKVAAEVAQPSPTFAPELEILFSARALMEAVF